MRGKHEGINKQKMEKAEPPSTDPAGLQLIQEALVSPSGPVVTHKVVFSKHALNALLKKKKKKKEKEEEKKQEGKEEEEMEREEEEERAEGWMEEEGKEGEEGRKAAAALDIHNELELQLLPMPVLLLAEHPAPLHSGGGC